LAAHPRTGSPELDQASIASAPGATGSWDRRGLEQVVASLLSNAMKFAPGTTIDLAVDVEEKLARIVVRDRGTGIAPENRARIFGRFERAVSTQHHGGLGLGLYITQRIVEAHGGTVRLESEPGTGAKFIVELPR
jgi:signal transduction histidine kinase